MDFINEIVELNESNVYELVKTKLQSNEDPLKIMDKIKQSSLTLKIKTIFRY